MHDRFGNPISCESAQAVDLYNAAADSLFSLQNSAREQIDQCLALDPTFALAHSLNARICFIEGNAQGAVSAAELGVTHAVHTTQRERQHVQLTADITTGNTSGLLQKVKEHAQQYPRDALPLSYALGVYSLLGFGGFVDHHEQQCDLLLGLADHWGDDDWWFNTWLGWSLVEAKQWQKGIPLLDRALEQNPRNANAAHGRAHGYYEIGEVDEAQKFIGSWLPSYEHTQPLHCHMSWHLALCSLQKGDCATAYQIYLDAIQPSVSKSMPMFTMVDCAAFAWRAQLQGHEMDKDKLEELNTFTNSHFPKLGIPFVNLHKAMVLGLSDPQKLSEYAQQMQQQTSTMDHKVAADVGRALYGFCQQDYVESAAIIEENMERLSALGGSNAQRDVFIDTTIRAKVKINDQLGAQDILNRRRHSRASHLNGTWMTHLQ